LMEHYQVSVVPRVVGVDVSRGFALLSWIDGAPIDKVSNSDVDAAVKFLATLHDLRNMPCAIQQPLAAEACLSGSEIERQIAMRLERLRLLAPDEHELFDFIDKYFCPV